jgi:hypothetical protein
LLRQFLEPGKGWTGVLNFALTLFVITSVGLLLLLAVARWVGVLAGLAPAREAKDV